MSWIKYIDCMDKKEGLPSLKDKSIDLCITDPPFNIKYKPKGRQLKINYEDENKDYINWCKKWFNELLRICKGLIIFPGNKNAWNYPKPRDILIHYKPNAHGGGSVSHLVHHDLILCYGKFNSRVKLSVFKYHMQNGFLNKYVYIHPCPNNEYLYMDLISQLEPKSVIDPFMGSGTTADACIRLGIEYYGYEKEKAYKVDIDNRIQRAVNYRKQIDNTNSLF